MKTKLVLAAVIVGGAFAASNGFAQTCRAPQPTICARECWSARAPDYVSNTNDKLNRAVIHHTASSGHWSTAGLNESKANVRGVQNYHMDGQGWGDIGYHFLVDKLGNIFAARKGSMSDYPYPRGAHDGCNEDSFGFTAMGYFHSPYNNQPSTALLNSLEKVIAWRMPGGWSPITGAPSLPSYCGNGALDAVISHRQVKATACPGDLLETKVKNGNGFEDAIKVRRACP
jgi:hypothetical protein